jgi:hypothetical protein
MDIKYIPENQTPDSLGRVYGYNVNSALVNVADKIITLNWEKCLYVAEEKDKVVHTKVESINNSYLMREFDADGNVVMEEYDIIEQTIVGEDEEGNPIIEETITTGERIKQTPAVDQWIEILLQYKKVSVETLIISFILEMEGEL